MRTVFLNHIWLTWYFPLRIEAGVTLWHNRGFHNCAHCANRISFLIKLLAYHCLWVAQLNEDCFSESYMTHLIFPIANWSRSYIVTQSWLSWLCACCVNRILFLLKLLAYHCFWVAQLDEDCFSESHMSHLTFPIANWSRSYIMTQSWLSQLRAPRASPSHSKEGRV